MQEMNEAADTYFKQWADNPTPILRKPFTDLDETPELLSSFAQLVQGLHLSPGDVVLDFGSGACWSTRFLVQMGFEVIALDVSAQALELGQPLFVDQPPIGDTIPPRFLVFEGHRIDLPPDSVDAIFCNDAFHHVPNPEVVLMEFGRIAKPGAIAGFSEPGPGHARTPRGQIEMRNFGVIERDIIVEEIWEEAQRAGCSDMQIAVFNTGLCLVSLSEFNEGLAKRSGWDAFTQSTRTFLSGRRTFFLHWPPPRLPDSRRPAGLASRIDVRYLPESVAQGDRLLVPLTLHNTGTSVWLASNAPFGPVFLGVMRRDAAGEWVDHGRCELPTVGEEGGTAGVMPGRSVHLDAEIVGLEPGRQQLRLDLVSERVAWFGSLGSTAIEFEILVR